MDYNELFGHINFYLFPLTSSALSCFLCSRYYNLRNKKIIHNLENRGVNREIEPNIPRGYRTHADPARLSTLAVLREIGPNDEGRRL